MDRFRFVNDVKSLGYVNLAFMVIIIALIGLCFTLNRSIDLAKQEQLIRLEPDLRVSTVRKVWEVPPAFVYSFALTIVQKVNNWQINGDKEYAENLMSLQNYITPSCRNFLQDDYVKKKASGQLQSRSRFVMETSGVGFNGGQSTAVIGKGAWDVGLTLNVKEFVNEVTVKNIDVYWPVRIVEFNIDPELNPQGLALDCFSSQPTLLKDRRL